MLFEIKFRNRTAVICLIVLQDNCMPLPIILGRDFLKASDIVLAQVKRLKYSQEALKNLNLIVNDKTFFCAPKSDYFPVLKQLNLLKPQLSLPEIINNDNDE